MQKWRAGDCAGAYEDFLAASDGDDIEVCAINNVGVVLANGCPAAGIKKDMALAVSEYKVSANLHCASGYANLGLIYEREKNTQDAIDAFTWAAYLGDKGAAKHLNALGDPKPSSKTLAEIERFRSREEAVAKRRRDIQNQLDASAQKLKEAEARLAEASIRAEEADLAVENLAAQQTTENAAQSARLASQNQRVMQNFQNTLRRPSPASTPVVSSAVPTSPTTSYAQTLPRIVSPTTAVGSSGCSDDWQCGTGRVCLKASTNVGTGTCVAVTDKSGVVPKFAAQQGTVRTAGGCLHDGDCALGDGYRCVKARSTDAYGMCLRP
jgi:hypothetical protein